MKGQKFEESLARLEKIVEKLEEGKISLEESFRLFEEGVALVRFCSSKIKDIEKKVKVLTRKQDGKLAEEDFSEDEAAQDSEPEEEGSIKSKKNRI